MFVNRTLLISLAVLGSLVGAPAAHAADHSPQTLLQEINDARAAHGVPAVTEDPQLDRAARGHTRDMVAAGYFAHGSPSGGDLLDRVRRTGWAHGRTHYRIDETLGFSDDPDTGFDEIVQAWLESPPHRSTLLSPTLRVVGVGIAEASPTDPAGLTVTADFGTSRGWAGPTRGAARR
jgi:uncharacterized protein YkwD